MNIASMSSILSLRKLDIKPKYFFILLALLQFICWTSLPYMIRDTLNHDVLEGLAWGFEWQLGYDKHPPFTAWVLSGWLACAQYIGINIELATYALAQIVLISAFYPLYRLSLAFFPYRAAVVATTLLTGILYFSTRSMNLTPDTMQTPLWAWSIWVFYSALHHNTARAWLTLAVINAIALWTKYSGVLLIFSQFLVLVSTKEYRQYLHPLKNTKVYFAVLFGALLFVPHLIWLIQNDFLPLYYAKALVVNPTPALYDHIIVIFQYLITQLPLLIIPLSMLWCFYTQDNQNNRETHKNNQGNNENISIITSNITSHYKNNNTLWRWLLSYTGLEPKKLKFILLLGLLPFLITIAQSVVTGQKVIGRWSTPYYCCIGILLVLTLGHQQIHNITDKQWHRYLATWLGFFFMILIGRHALYYGAPYLGKLNSDVYYPTKIVTQQFEQFWKENTSRPLSYVIGDRYWTTYISVYAKSALPKHPHVFLEANPKMSPWINMTDLHKEGAMIIWLAKSLDESTLPPEYAHLARAQFVKVQAVPKNLGVKLKGKAAQKAHLLIGMGWIPPEDL